MPACIFIDSALQSTRHPLLVLSPLVSLMMSLATDVELTAMPADPDCELFVEPTLPAAVASVNKGRVLSSAVLVRCLSASSMFLSAAEDVALEPMRCTPAQSQ